MRKARWFVLWLAATALVQAAVAAPSSAGGLSAPVFLPVGGVYTNALAVSMSCTGQVALIRYTADGSEPTTNSLVYTSAVAISRSTCLRARAFTPGGPPGPVAGAGYTLLGASLLDFESNLPILVLDTFGGDIEKDHRIPAYLTALQSPAGGAALRGPAQAHGRAGVEYRGSSSMRFPKRALRLEIENETTGGNRRLGLLGLPADADWVLYPPYSDKTFMRNVLAFDLWEAMGHYSVRRRFVEVFCKQHAGPLGPEDYAGVYLLLEKIKQGKARVKVSSLAASETTEPAISGGYILKKDRVDENDNAFRSSLGHVLGIEYPKGSKLNREQRQWITRWVNEFEGVLMSTNYANPRTGYARYIDVPSFVDHLWIVELPRTVDGYYLSVFMHKDRDGRLAMGPIWDRDLSLGNANYQNGDEPEGWYWQEVRDPFWYHRLLCDPDFRQQSVDRWGELRQGLFATSNLLGRVQSYATLLQQAQARDFARWPRLGHYVWPNAAADWPNTSFADSIRYMTNFLRHRLAWIDAQFVPAPALSRAGGPIPAGFQLHLGGPTNQVLYTLDGSDPRLPGGAANPAARAYSGPIALTPPVRVLARTRSGNDWSPPASAQFQKQP